VSFLNHHFYEKIGYAELIGEAPTMLDTLGTSYYDSNGLFIVGKNDLCLAKKLWIP